MHTHICCPHPFGEWFGSEGYHNNQICCFCGVVTTVSIKKTPIKEHGSFKPKDVPIEPGPVRLVPPTAPVQHVPENRCPLCLIILSDTMMFVCSNPRCPCGLGPTYCI